MRMPLGLAWGNLDDAIKYLAKAVELRGDFIMFRLDYARALQKDDKLDQAREQLKEIASLKVQEYGDEERKKEAAYLLESIKGK
jgi:hypothetical protein